MIQNCPSRPSSFLAQKQAVFGRLKSPQKTAEIMFQVSQLADQALLQLWETQQLPKTLNVIALGGYGRAELAPASDIDLLILVPSHTNKTLNERIKQWISLAWDEGLTLSVSVRTAKEALFDAQQDLAFQTALLEARLVIGAPELFKQFQENFFQQFNQHAFFQAKMLEKEERYQRFQNTAYNLEPNIKDSPGGIRDIHHVKWLALAAGFGKTWADFKKHQLLTPKEATELKHYEQLFNYLRIQLHRLTQRKQDTLFFDQQTQLALHLKYRHSKYKQAHEKLMQRYYWIAKSINYLTHVMEANIKSKLFPMTSEVILHHSEIFHEVQGMLEVSDIHLFSKHPEYILEAFLLYATRTTIKDFSITTLRALYEARDKMDARWRQLPRNRLLFMTIFQQPHRLIKVLHLMNETQVLGAYLLNFRRIIGQMQHDLYHVYTVDQHTLLVIQYLKYFTSAEHAHEYPLCSVLMNNFDRPWLLYIAGLFHDIAKGRRGDHSLLGTKDAYRFCLRHKLAKNDTELIVWLVQHHLKMSHVAQKEDIHDPRVIHQFAQFIGNQRYLDALYLLTVADIRGTSPVVWNSWKAKLLEDLYYATKRVLSGESVSLHHVSQNRKDIALSLMNQKNTQVHQDNSFWHQLDIGYFLKHEAEDIAWHTAELDTLTHTDQIIVKCRLHQNTIQVLVYKKDCANLFANITYYFAKNRFSILDAKLNTTQHKYALDHFVIQSQDEQTLPFAELAQQIEHNLTQHLAKQHALAKPFKARLSRRSRSFHYLTHHIQITPDAQQYYWILSISTVDHLGLLYSIAHILAQHKIDVYAARINTLGERIEDIFLIRSEQLQDNHFLLKLKTELYAIIQQ